MKLCVKDRIVLAGILPQHEDFLTLQIVRKLQEALSFSEEETKALNLVNDGQQVKWEATADPMKDVEIGIKAADLIVASLKKLDEKKELTADTFGLYETFVQKGLKVYNG
jgi:type III secretion system FlhB-like substrate exporter